MLQKVEEKRQARFLKVVSDLKLRFPNKEITSKTKYNSGIVSEYLNSKKNVSESFLREFCKAFDLSYEDLFVETPFDADDPLNVERAKVAALERKLAMVMSMVYQLQGKTRSYKECLDEIDHDTTVILTDLRRSGKKV